MNEELPPLTVEEARKQRICRVCRRPIAGTGPTGWPLEFREMVWPVKVTLNFGEEFSHTDCLPPATPKEERHAESGSE